MSGFFAATIISSAASAALLDLTTPQLNTHFDGAVGYGLFSSGANTGSIGTGVFGTFVQIGTGTGNQSVTAAYNTKVDGVLDNGQADNFNHEIGYGDVSIVDVNGTLYRQFDLDTNEPNSAANRLISITGLRIYLGDSPNPSTTDLSQLGTLIFDLGPDNSIRLDDSLNNGSGNGIDMVFLVPNIYFTSPARYIFLYSEFSQQAGGFEEWATSPCQSTPEVQCIPRVRPQETIPEPATLLLSGIGFAGLGWSRRRKQ